MLSSIWKEIHWWCCFPDRRGFARPDHLLAVRMDLCSFFFHLVTVCPRSLSSLQLSFFRTKLTDPGRGSLSLINMLPAGRPAERVAASKLRVGGLRGQSGCLLSGIHHGLNGNP
ncbi:unnamed protein product [Gulo gulo]|uniref:Uncharacterized protein n=1 Tax=Gulo gulo TaxID=48420 RepID=A0A9X9M3N3_GULGU|nr:unnamed protein product [Gulo gulo]